MSGKLKKRFHLGSVDLWRDVKSVSLQNLGSSHLSLIEWCHSSSNLWHGLTACKLKNSTIYSHPSSHLALIEWRHSSSNLWHGLTACKLKNSSFLKVRGKYMLTKILKDISSCHIFHFNKSQFLSCYILDPIIWLQLLSFKKIMVKAQSSLLECLAVLAKEIFSKDSSLLNYKKRKKLI